MHMENVSYCKKAVSLLNLRLQMAQMPTMCGLQSRLSEFLKRPYQKFQQPLADIIQQPHSICWQSSNRYLDYYRNVKQNWKWCSIFELFAKNRFSRTNKYHKN